MKIDTALFTHPFETEENRKKFLIGSLITAASMFFFPLFPLVMGYGARMFRRVLDGRREMPEWDEWGELFMDGLRTWGAMMVYFLPLFVVLFIVFGLWSIFPIFIALLENGGASEGLGAAAAMGIFFPSTLLMALVFPLSLAAIIPAQVGWARAAHRQSFTAGIQLRQVWTLLRANPGDFILALVIWYSIGMALALLFNVLIWTIVCMCLFPLLMPAVSFYSQLLQALLLGEAYRETLAKTSPAELILEEE